MRHYEGFSLTEQHYMISPLLCMSRPGKFRRNVLIVYDSLSMRLNELLNAWPLPASGTFIGRELFVAQ